MVGTVSQIEKTKRLFVDNHHLVAGHFGLKTTAVVTGIRSWLVVSVICLCFQ